MHVSYKHLDKCACAYKSMHAFMNAHTGTNTHTKKQRQRLAPGIEKYTSLLVSSVASRTQQSSREVQSKTEGKIKRKTRLKFKRSSQIMAKSKKLASERKRIIIKAKPHSLEFFLFFF